MDNKRPENMKRIETPELAREFIEEQIGYPITMVSNGPARSDIIYRELGSHQTADLILLHFSGPGVAPQVL